MRNKGFTLIELLAVIVILAIIALIATPIILGIINDARIESYKRSIELYAKSIENQIAKSQLNGSQVAPGDLSSAFLNTIEYNGSRVVCTTNKSYSDGTVYLSGCTVGGKAVDYSYGTEKTDTEEELTEVSPPQYYTYNFLGDVGGEDVPENPTLPTGQNVYLGYDVDNGVVSAAYVCFKRNGEQYCLKGYDASAYSDNEEIIRDAFKDVVDTSACSFEDFTDDEGHFESISCDADDLHVFASSKGEVAANECDVIANGGFGCLD